MKKYIDCRLTIWDEEKIEYEDDYHKGKTEGKIQTDDLTLRTIKSFNKWVDSDKPSLNPCCNREDLEVLGEHLYKLLFTADLAKMFEESYINFEREKFENPEKRLRLILIFYPEAENWALYPWEFLFMPYKPAGFFLASKTTDLILTRFVPEAGVLHKEREEGPLKILIAFSHPRELQTITADDIIEQIKNLKTEGIIEVDEPLDNPSFTVLKEKINSFKPDILHFIGHGKPGKIAFIKEEEDLRYEKTMKGPENAEEAEWIESKMMNVLFDAHQPHFVFLHACWGAIKESFEGFKSTARELVYSKIPVVVAMQYEISNADAVTFAAKFYQQIGEGKQIDEAVSEARYALATRSVGTGRVRAAWNDRAFGTPVVYLQTETPLNVPKRPKKIELTPVKPTKVPCPNPNCSGWIISGRKICLACGSDLILCPQCKNLITLDYGCDSCGYGVKQKQIRSKAGEIKPQAKVLEPASEPPIRARR
ncbi:CHAT domain protein [uncultured archaeon]|nr:CHAT domain protein [uncultured archaeon]